MVLILSACDPLTGREGARSHTLILPKRHAIGQGWIADNTASKDWGHSFPFRKVAAGSLMGLTTKPTMKSDDTKNRKLTNSAIATLFMVAGGLIDTYGEKALQHIKGWLENQAEEARMRARTQEAEIRNVAEGH
ncbi:MAG: hypothetical protein ACOYM3_15985 [Terrimicrobiaceae bacterium]